jgi:uncharacterized protein YegJ (DUF2314 family)
MNAQIRINKDTDAVEIFTGDKWVATYVQEDIDETQALWYSKGHTDGQKINTLKELTDTEIADALYVADITLDNLSDGDIPIERINAFAGAVIRKAQEK